MMSATPLYDSLAYLCDPCRSSDHEGCHGTVLETDELDGPGRQYAACACTCGGGAEAWRAYQA
jgi:hypothetical protein